MTERLFVGTLGHRNSGKSATWNALFGASVRTGRSSRALTLHGGECAEVFLISGSPEERKVYAGDILDGQDCRIVLCSMQYTENVFQTIDFATANGFALFIQFLNPGYSDAGENDDSLGLIPRLLSHGTTVAVRNGKVPPEPRTEEIRQFIYGWAKARGLTFICR